LLSLEKAPIADAAIFTNGSQLGFTIPVLMPDRYFTLNTDNIDSFYDRFNIPIRPKRLISKADIARTIRFSSRELDNISKDYGAFISRFIREEDVKYGKTLTIKVGNEETKGREVMVMLDSANTEALFKGLLNKIAADDTLLKTTYGSSTDISGLLVQTGIFEMYGLLEESGYLQLNDFLKEIISSANIKKDLDGFKKALKGLADRTRYPDGLKMVLVIDGAGNILDRRLDISYERNDGSVKCRIGIHSGSNDIKRKDLKNGFCDIEISNITGGGERLSGLLSIDARTTYLPKNNDEKGTVGITYAYKKNDIEQNAIQLKLDISDSTEALTMKKSNMIKYDIEFRADNASVIDRLNGEINSTSGKNNKLKTESKNTGITINLALPSMNLENMTLKLNLTSEDRFDIEEFSLPQVQTANSIDLSNISDEGLAKLEEEILASFGTFYLSNKPIIDAVMGAE